MWQVGANKAGPTAPAAPAERRRRNGEGPSRAGSTGTGLSDGDVLAEGGGRGVRAGLARIRTGSASTMATSSVALTTTAGSIVMIV